ncbi:MAG: hypothetical protein EP326_01920 [Deltaproteobacteria bacterium]|nr:MAG: hypothetical protein EP326_01920 [Deltaproteobacteria bacterium]TNF26424.1 MAG: hypothetical protein EP319_13935 [Deltaproteobacteria bacterium]
MKMLLLKLLMMFTATGFAGTQDCVECASRFATTPTVSMTHTNTNEMRHLASRVETSLAAPELDHDLNADICDFMIDGDFDGVLLVLSEAGLKFEDVYTSVHCGPPYWTPLHIINRFVFVHTRVKFWAYFDKIKSTNPSFSYEKMLNTPFGTPATTLLDDIDYQLTLLNKPEDIKQIKKFRLEVIERGGKRISEL